MTSVTSLTKMKTNFVRLDGLPWLLLVLILTGSCEKIRKEEEDKLGSNRPNILLIMADDMGFSDLGCFGSEINTPNLDALAANGLRYTQFYNSARCCPTRASLLTGLYPHQTGVGAMTNMDRGFDGYRADLNNKCVTIAEALKEANYATYMCGKWHVTRFIHPDSSKHNWPVQRGFDKFYGSLAGFGRSGFYHTKTLTYNNTPLPVPVNNFYYTNSITDSAAQFIQDHLNSKKEEPFFMYLAYTAPHWPLHAPEEDIVRYQGKYDAGWDAVRKKRYEKLQELGVVNENWQLTLRDTSVGEWKNTDHKAWEARRMEVHASMVDLMDQGIGKVIQVLKKNGQLENTVILFLSDNGGSAEEIMPGGWFEKNLPDKTPDGRAIHRFNLPHILAGADTTYQSIGVPWANVSNSPFQKYKRYLHEGGIATPLVAHWPAGIDAKGELRSQPAHVMDIMATCLDVAGADYPEEYKNHAITPMEGKSLVTTFTNFTKEERTLCWEHLGRRAIRKGNFKLVSVERAGKGNWELYDMENDRTETKNLASEKPDVVQQLASEWEEWAEKVQVKPWPWSKARGR